MRRLFLLILALVATTMSIEGVRAAYPNLGAVGAVGGAMMMPMAAGHDCQWPDGDRHHHCGADCTMCCAVVPIVPRCAAMQPVPLTDYRAAPLMGRDLPATPPALPPPRMPAAPN